MNTHQITLQPYKGIPSRYTCPQCGHRQKFTRYIDVTTGEYIADHVGRCDRENNCGYHYKPRQYFAENPENRKLTQNWKLPEPLLMKSRPVNYLPHAFLEKSVANLEQCSLYQYFEKLFRKEVARRLCKKYLIGADNNGNTAFWQVDFKGKIRQVKFMEYNPFTGRRNKDKGALFAGKRLLNNNDANLKQCFFGEHLLSIAETQGKPVGIVESEKTAAIASIYYPEFVWIATGGLNGCKWTEKVVCSVLEGRKVVLFPDLGAFESWSEKGKLITNIARCKVATMDILELNATPEEREKGLDIADYLTREDDGSGLALTDYHYPVIWDYKL